MKKLCEFGLKVFIVYAVTALWLLLGYAFCKPVLEKLIQQKIVTLKVEVSVWPTVEHAPSDFQERN